MNEIRDDIINQPDVITVEKNGTFKIASDAGAINTAIRKTSSKSQVEKI